MQVNSTRQAHSLGAVPRGAAVAVQLRALLRSAAELSAALLSAMVVACAPGGVTGEDALPTGTPDPATVQTPGGALAFYHTTVASMSMWLDPLIVTTGVLTDELVDLPIPLFWANGYTNLDSRTTVADDALYNALHRLRAQAREARGFIGSYLADRTYLTDTAATFSPSALQGHLYALEGYAEVLLADLFCSGIPLSTVDYQADYTLTAGFRTDEVYAHAAALFDSALALLGDSVRLQQLARVGRGRALLGRGDYAGAAAAVVAVAADYQYPVLVSASAKQPELLASFAAGYQNAVGFGMPNMADREGVNGMDYRSSEDPRTPSVLLGQDYTHNDMYFPAKYPQDGTVTFLLADGVEARLIAAEAALQTGSDAWLTSLNMLRTDGTFDEQPTADPNDDPAATDTLWHAGTGGVAGLGPLADPGTAEGRVDLVFRERAFWLYLTGHRQGDLRRLVRQYHRDPNSVYPTGPYAGGGGSYGTAVVFGVPAEEIRLNPKYTGCIHQGA